jgi:hypothetical protein
MTYSGYGKYMQLKPQVLSGNVTRAKGLRAAINMKLIGQDRESSLLTEGTSPQRNI